MEARASGFDLVRFHGFGNEASAPGPEAFYRVRQEQYLVAPSLVVPVSRAARLSVGPLLKFAQTTPRSGTFLDSLSTLQPVYGVGEFGQLGAQATLRLDTRNRSRAATRGVFFTVGGGVYAAAWDVTSTFGEGHAEATAYLSTSLPLQPTLALRVAGKKVWGTYPFQEAAYVGGASTVRGFPEHRFAGDAALFGNAELRLFLTKFFLLLPSELGVFGLADAGRVYLSGETSDRWHASAGGGLWLALLNRANTLSVAAARSAEGTRIYVRAGFAF